MLPLASSDRQSADGCRDVLLKTLPSETRHLAARVMELKVDNNAQTDGALAAAVKNVALAQVKRLDCGHGLAGAGLARWDFALCGKHVAVVCERVF